jgi:hypothetical protein
MPDQITLTDTTICSPPDQPPQVVDADGTETWLTRGRTFVVAISRVKPGSCLRRQAQSDEYILLTPKGVRATAQAGGETAEADGAGDALTIFPLGDSEAVFHDGGWVTRIFSHRAADLLAGAVNAACYDGLPAASDALPAPPPGGWKLRHYPVDLYNKPGERWRVFQSTNLMVNVIQPRDFRRDITKMTPHSHADFDQASLALQGSFVHHLRYPWRSDMTQWREDQHPQVGSPSVIIIPAQVIHTTQDVGEGWVQLVDIFSPPRPDFLERDSILCNAADYPLARLAA